MYKCIFILVAIKLCFSLNLNYFDLCFFFDCDSIVMYCIQNV